MERIRVSEVTVRGHHEIVLGNWDKAIQEPGIDKRIWNLVRDKFRMGGKDKGCQGSTWGAFCAMECMLRYLCMGDVDEAINIRGVLSDYDMGGNRAAENYTFGCDATFERTVPANGKLEEDYQRVLNGCTAKDSVQKVIVQLYQYVLPDKRDAFRNAAQHAFGVRL